MVQSLEAIKGGGGSIRVGATGTISSLMTRELESMKAPSQKPSSSSSSSRNKTQGVPYGGSSSPPTPRRLLQPKKSSDEASSSKGSDYKNPDLARKTKGYPKNTHKIPMLGSDNIALDRTPSIEKLDKKGPINIVEVVDIKCGNLDSNKAWTSPIKSRLRKLGFSKLSESTV